MNTEIKNVPVDDGDLIKKTKEYNPNKVEYTKKIFTGVFILTILVVVFGCYMTYRTNDTSIIITIISATFAELATHTAVYAWKTKSINKTRIIIDFINNLPDDVNTKEGIINTMINNMN